MTYFRICKHCKKKNAYYSDTFKEWTCYACHEKWKGEPADMQKHPLQDEVETWWNFLPLSRKIEIYQNNR